MLAVARRPAFFLTKRIFSTALVEMEHHQVVPDVLDATPAEILQVTYGPNKVNMGNELTPTQVKEKPKVKWSAKPGTLYTLCMTDPDAPSRKEPKFREWHHWLVGNIPNGDVSEGEVLSDYIGSGPPPDTGLHRYVFVLYKQQETINFDEKRLTNTSADHRANFSIRTFAKKYKLGTPVAANFYQAQFDDYVPILYKQLGG